MLAELALMSLVAHIVTGLSNSKSVKAAGQALSDDVGALTEDIVLRVRLAQGTAERQRAVRLVGEEAVRLLKLLDDQRRLGLISGADFDRRAEAIVVEALAAQSAIQSGSAIPQGQIARKCPHCGGPVIGNDSHVCQHCGRSMLKSRCPQCHKANFGESDTCSCGYRLTATSLGVSTVKSEDVTAKALPKPAAAPRPTQPSRPVTSEYRPSGYRGSLASFTLTVSDPGLFREKPVAGIWVFARLPGVSLPVAKTQSDPQGKATLYLGPGRYRIAPTAEWDKTGAHSWDVEVGSDGQIISS